MKKALVSLCASTVCAGVGIVASPVAAFASVKPPSMTEKVLAFNQKIVSKPYGFVYKGTTYLPIWYMMQALDKLKIRSTWAAHSWSLTPPGKGKLNTGNVKAGSGSGSIYVNGQLVQRVNQVTARDPNSGRQTTYMPVWYIMQVLQRLHVNSKWNGTAWQVYTSSQAPSVGNLDIQPNTRHPASRSLPSISSLGQQIVHYAEKFIGTPYRYGGTSRDGFDCSGFVQYVFKHFDISLPRTAAEQARVGRTISSSSLQPGDLVFFDTGGPTLSHVGIYVGSGKFISATTSDGVQIANVHDPYYWGSRFELATAPGV